MNRYNEIATDQISKKLLYPQDEIYTYMLRRWDERKISDKYRYGNYHTNAPAIACSYWLRARKVIMCGTPGFNDVPSYCNCDMLCDICAARKARRSYVRYQNTFHKAINWYAITYSFKSNVFINKSNQSEYLSRWKVADTFIKSLRTNDLIQGAYAVREVIINSFADMVVFPHTHIVANSNRSDLINEDGTLHPQIAEEAAKADVSLKITRITEESDFLYEVKYPIKPINIKVQYDLEAINTSYHKINRGLDTVLYTITEWQLHMPRLVYYGNMDARCKSYMGTKMNVAKNTAKKLLTASSKKTTKTKELNYISPSVNISAEQVNTVNTTIMPNVFNPVLPPRPPQRKKPSFFKPLALTGLGLAGADLLFNKGKGSSSILNSIRGILPQAKDAPFVPADTSVDSIITDAKGPGSLRPAVTTADIIADGAAGYTGRHADLTNTSGWKGLFPFSAQVGGHTAFPNTPGEFAGDINKYNFRPEVNTLVGQISDSIAKPVAIGSGLDTLRWLTGVAASKGVQYTTPGSGVNSVLARASGTLTNPRLFGAPAKAGFLNSFRFSNPGIVSGTLGVGTGLTSGYSLGSNPLLNEAYSEGLGLSPETAAKLTKGVGATLGAVAGLHPLGWIPTVAAGAIANSAADQVRTMAGSASERGALSDFILRLHRGTKAGIPGYADKLKEVIAWVDSDPRLTQSVNQGINPDISLTGTTDSGSPALKHLIDTARKNLAQ